MSPGPQVSVVMPLYDKERDVGASIESVLRQSMRELELIVVDDGSTDGGPEVVRRVADPRVRLVRQRRSGVSVARNRGIAEASADLVAFLDADDLWDVAFLETLLRLRAAFPQCQVFATNYRYLLPGGGTRPTMLRGIPAPAWQGVLTDYFGVAAHSDPPLWTSALGVARRALEAVGGFPATLRVSEDLVTWARLALSHAIAYSATPSASYRLREALYGATRDPDLDAEAGTLLEALVREADRERGASLGRYLSWWYRNRASRYLRLGRSASARQELRNMRRFQDADLRYYVYAVVSRLPPPAAAQLARGFTLGNRFRRMFPRPAPVPAPAEENGVLR